jgi:hypothetical protein
VHEVTVMAPRLYLNVNKYYNLSIYREKMKKISTRCKLVYIRYYIRNIKETFVRSVRNFVICSSQALLKGTVA